MLQLQKCYPHEFDTKQISTNTYLELKYQHRCMGDHYKTSTVIKVVLLWLEYQILLKYPEQQLFLEGKCKVSSLYKNIKVYNLVISKHDYIYKI